ncbi:hypothetical protein N7532_002930 [Penicillium argentinense]|uniref:Uncharacterized protein n=1 Tax=Penicillium argentinense TaxID=1131581 RepID=A0A9W9G284_9EURO|nr:uncharacterized protein N7532_002930 [Penicillium argentinense]KAJ5110285.1 hypothetical protein N7532_002930 [Penicillium argentinense]
MDSFYPSSSSASASLFLPSELSSSGFSSTESESQHPLTKLAKQVKLQQQFTSEENLLNELNRRHRELLKDETREQYLCFSSVPLPQASALSHEQSQVSKFCRFSFDIKTGTLVAKVMPGRIHEIAIRTFERLFLQEMDAINMGKEIEPSGSVIVNFDNWTNEADSCFSPTTPDTDPPLTFIVEVGLAESVGHLTLDARGWLESESSTVQLALTISIPRDKAEVVFQQWERDTRGLNTRTRSHFSAARIITSVKLSRANNETSVTGESYVNEASFPTTQLALPLEKILNRTSVNSQRRDLVISEEKLRCFAETIWKRQSLM